MPVRATAGGAFDRSDRNAYFLAAVPSQAGYMAGYPHVLMACNELKDPAAARTVGELIAAGTRVLMDSGIFNLACRHARRHGLSMDQALSVAPGDVDGFEDLLTLYLSMGKSFGPHLWGYIELDQGGKENKRKTRAMLEGEGLSPIPVYHPVNDGPEYFDELAERYDRICLGNIVKAPAPVRKKILAWVWERRQRYPDLWIHVLGIHPSPLMTAFPFDSADASTWTNGFRWPGSWKGKAGQANLGAMGPEMIYRRLDVDPTPPEDFDPLGEDAAPPPDGRTPSYYEQLLLMGREVVACERAWRHQLGSLPGAGAVRPENLPTLGLDR